MISPFRLNPFEVPQGVPVSVHLDMLRSVFNASFGMWEPLPAVLERSLHEVYTDRGWNTTNNTNARLAPGSYDAMAFPTLADLVQKVDEVSQSLGYEQKVTDNIRAALMTRLNGLRAGGKGQMLDVQRSLPMNWLLNQRAVVELEGMGDDDDKAFVMGLLIIRVVEHWRTVGKSEGLKHLLVIEEAHRLLTNVSTVSNQEQSNPRGKAVEAFANLLAEVRTYGQGIIVADQVPVKLAPDVIKNTNLKIAHRVVDAEDRKALAGSMAMTEQQERSLAILKRGEAAIFAEGDDAPLLIHVERPPKRAAGAVTYDSDQVRDYMLRQRHTSAYDSIRTLFDAHPGCADTGVGAGALCDAARMLALTPRLRKSYARLAISLLFNFDSLDRLWEEDLLPIVRSQYRTDAAEQRLLRCLAYHTAHEFAHRRGAQAGWLYQETGELALKLQTVILAKIKGHPAKAAWSDYCEYMTGLLNQYRVRCPACAVIDEMLEEQKPVTCPFLYPVTEIVASGVWSNDWQTADRMDMANHGRPQQKWNICTNASYTIIEDPQPGSAVETRKAAVRACLCFAYQMLLRNNKVGILTRDLKKVMEEYKTFL
jgi:hypothetical protein